MFSILTITAGIGWLDYLTGPEIAFSLFYILPVAAAGWLLGPGKSVVVAVAATAAMYVADVVLRDPSEVLIPILNTASRFVIFVAAGVLIARLRQDRIELAQANAQLKAFADQEAILARTDALTGLPNSRSFIETLRTELARQQRDPSGLCVAYLDVDNFKSVNDSYGHAAGDSVLRAIASSIRSCARASDVPARLGGDEFAMLLWNVEVEVAVQIAHRFVLEIRKVGLEYPRAGLGASVGVAHFSTPPEDPELVVHRADEAMYVAKSAGKGRVHVWRDRSPAHATQA